MATIITPATLAGGEVSALPGNGNVPHPALSPDMNDVHPAVKKLITVCRCNNIKYGTIERALDAGARTIAEVAAKTTGTCGGTCTPRVLEMIEARWPAAPAVPDAAVDDAEDAWWIRK